MLLHLVKDRPYPLVYPSCMLHFDCAVIWSEVAHGGRASGQNTQTYLSRESHVKGVMAGHMCSITSGHYTSGAKCSIMVMQRSDAAGRYIPAHEENHQEPVAGPLPSYQLLVDGLPR